MSFSAAFSLSRWVGIIVKEFTQLRRDRLTFGMIIGIPVLQLILFGYAINSDPKQLPTAVLAADSGPYSRSVLAAMQTSGYFRIVRQVANERELDELLAQGRVQFALTIPENFDRKLPTSHAEISRTLHHVVCLLHPTVMFRTRVVHAVGPYSLAYPAAEDYEFFWRIARRFPVANIPEMLHTQRFHDGSISVRNRRRQLRTKLRIQLEYFRAAEPLSYYGVAKTLALMSLPYSSVVAIKGVLSRRSA